MSKETRIATLERQVRNLRDFVYYLASYVGMDAEMTRNVEEERIVVFRGAPDGWILPKEKIELLYEYLGIEIKKNPEQYKKLIVQKKEKKDEKR